MKKIVIIPLILLSYIYAGLVSLTFDPVTSTQVNILMSNDVQVGGFQFDINGATANGASGGEATAAGFTISAAGSTVLGFSFTGATISTDCGLLLTLSLNGDATGLSNLVFSNSSAQNIDVSYYLYLLL